MTELGVRIRDLVEETAPPISEVSVVQHKGRGKWRALPVAVTAALAVLLIGGVSLLFRAESAPDSSLAVPSADRPVGTLTPTGVECHDMSAEFPCSNLLDNDPTTEWQSTGGVGDSVRVFFAGPVAIKSIGFINTEDDERFATHARIKAVEIAADGVPATTSGELADENGATQYLTVGSLRTGAITVTITDTYLGDGSTGNLLLAGLVIEGEQVELRNSDQQAKDVPLVEDSITIFGGTDLIGCAAAPEIYSEDGDGSVHATPRDALKNWIDTNTWSPPVASGGYIEMRRRGDDAYMYGIPLNGLREIPLGGATFGIADQGGQPQVGLDAAFVIEVRVVPRGDGWTVEYGQASGC